MPQVIGPQRLDESRAYFLTLSGAGEQPSLLGHFNGSEVLAATLSLGESYPILATLDAAWDTTNEGDPAAAAEPVVVLTIARAAIANLTPGHYHGRVVADPDSIDELLKDFAIRLTAAPGSAAMPRVYCDFADMVAEYSALGAVEDLESGRAAQFLPERAQAARWAEDQAMARWLHAHEAQAARRGTQAEADPITVGGGLDAGPWWGASTREDTALRTAETEFAAILESSGLMSDPPGDRGKLRRLTALYSLHLALDQAQGQDAGETSYRTLATSYRMRALRMLAAVHFRVDAPVAGVLDGVADYRLRP